MVEEILLGVADLVLHHPLDVRGIQIARHHVALPLLLVRHLVGIRRVPGAEAEFHLQLPLYREDRDGVDSEGQLEPQAWAAGADEPAEPLHHAHALGADGVDAAGEAGDEQERKRRREECREWQPAPGGEPGKLRLIRKAGEVGHRATTIPSRTGSCQLIETVRRGDGSRQ